MREPAGAEPHAAAVIREMVRHEDELRNQRLGWLFALNGFLFAALGFAWSDSDSAPLVVILAALGTSVAISAAAGEHISYTAIEQLREQWQQLPLEERTLPLTALDSDYFRRQKNVSQHIPKLYPWRLIPWMLAAAWIALLVVRLVQN